jgi:hypothetical protein
MTTVGEFFSIWGIRINDADLSRFDQKLDSVRKKADSFGSTVENLGSKWSASLGGIRRNAFYLAGMFGAEGFGFKKLFETIGGFEQIQVAFETMIGDTDRAKKALADLQAFAMRTPFNFKELAEGSKQLLAFGYEAEQLVPTMETLGNIAAGVGKDKLPHLIMALGQARAAGHLQGHILREFTMAGVPLGAELAKLYGSTQAATEGKIHSGGVPFADVEKALYNLTHGTGRFTDLLAKQSRTLLGMFSNTVDYLQLMAKRLGDRGLREKAKGYIAQFNTFLQTNDAPIMAFLDRLVAAMVKSFNTMIHFALGVNHVVHALGGWETVLTAVTYAMTALLSIKILNFIGDVTKGLIMAARAFTLFGEAGALASIEVLAIGAAIVGLLLLIEDVVSYFQGRDSITGRLFGSMEGSGATFGKFIQDLFGDFAAYLDKNEDFLVEKAKNIGKVIGKALIAGIIEVASPENWQQLGQAIIGALEFVIKAGTVLFDVGKSIADGIVEGLISQLKARFPAMAPLIDNASQLPGQLATVASGVPGLSSAPAVISHFANDPDRPGFLDWIKNFGFAGPMSAVSAAGYASGLIGTPSAGSGSPIFNITIDGAGKTTKEQARELGETAAEHYDRRLRQAQQNTKRVVEH